MSTQTLSIGVSITLVNNNLRTVIGLSDTFNTTGSNSLSSNANVNTGSWQVVDQGSNTNLRYLFANNLDLTSSVYIAIGSSSTSSYSAFLLPGDVAIIPNNGSTVPIFAKAPGSNGTIILQYLAVES